jgi:predicted transcriptional regulator
MRYVLQESHVFEKLPPRERQVFEALYGLGEATAEQIRCDMPDPPSNSAIRIMLGRLEKKGVITHRLEDQKYIYSPAHPNAHVRDTAVQHFVRTFFGGSPLGAAAALIGMSDKVNPEELDRVEQMIAKARQEQSR